MNGPGNSGPADGGNASGWAEQRRQAFALLDAVPWSIALLDDQGVIRLTNSAWNSQVAGEFVPGAVYVRACENTFVSLPEGYANRIGEAVRAVSAGSKNAWEFDFTAESGNGRDRIRASLAPLPADGWRGVLVSHTLSLDTPEGSGVRLQGHRMEAIGRLVGGIAHDFANLLTLIAGYSELVLNRLKPAEPVRAELEEIRRAAARGSRLTSQLLGFTRGQTAESRVLNLNTVIADMQRMLRPIIGEHIELETALSADLGLVKANTGQMEQVLMNLVLNARDAMPRGGKITIETCNLIVPDGMAGPGQPPAGSYITLELSDTGDGMDEHVMSHLFEPLFTTKERGKGTGLGLSTVYNIVKQTGGNVWARSAVGEGTSFTICLPRVEAAGAINETEESTPAPDARGAETILVVEDDDSVRRLLISILSRQGYTVLEAHDGPAALTLGRQHAGRIDLLLTDIMMPGMSGREVGKRFLRMRPGIRVIYMSGYTDDVLLRAGTLTPGMAFLQKPLRPAVLAGRVREVLDAALVKHSA